MLEGIAERARGLASRALYNTLAAVARRLPTREITGDRNDVYLAKHRVFESPGARNGWRVHLHHFLRPDEDRELHDHPWRWAISLVLWGGYAEERYAPAGVGVERRRRFFRFPGQLVLIDRATFHRVTALPEGECWTLFVTGPVVASWGFLARDEEFVPWREFFERKRVAAGKPRAAETQEE